MYQNTPAVTPYHDGKYGVSVDGASTSNLLADVMSRGGSYDDTRLNTTWYAKVNILDGLTAEARFNYQTLFNETATYSRKVDKQNFRTGEIIPGVSISTATTSRATTRYQNHTNTATINYAKTFGKHDISILLGTEQYYWNVKGLSATRTGLLDLDLPDFTAALDLLDPTLGGTAEQDYGVISYFGRLNYAYKNRYLLEANFRRDGSSRFGPDSRWGTFPSFSAAWRIINEPFMESTRDVLSDLKLRGGWGKLGNQQLGTDTRSYIEFYPYQSVLSQKNYAFGGTVNQGVAPVAGANSDLKWETSKTTNIGLDAGFLQNMFTISVDAYWKKTYDILMKLPVSTLYGLEAPYQNAGEVTNKGVEMQLGYKLSKNDFTFNVAANIAYNKNEVTNLHNDGAEIWLNSYSLRQEGLPINAFGGYEVLGIFTDEEIQRSE